MNTYLNNDNIKRIVKYLKSVLPPEKIIIIKEFEERGVHFSYDIGINEHRDNIKKIWGYYDKKFKEVTDKETLLKYEKFMRYGQWEYAGYLVKTYINNNHKKEHDIITSINLPEICDMINGITSIKSQAKLCKEISLKELILSDNYEKYLINNFGEKSISKELLKETERIADELDKQYFGRRGEKEYLKYQYAVKNYLITGDRQLFHNLLNIE